MLNPFLSDAVTRLRASTTTDRYGNVVPGAVTETTISGVCVVPPTAQIAASVEDVDQREHVADTRVLLAPAGSDIRATDQIRHGSVTYEVTGTPAGYPGTLAHVEVLLRAVTG